MIYLAFYLCSWDTSSNDFSAENTERGKRSCICVPGPLMSRKDVLECDLVFVERAAQTKADKLRRTTDSHKVAV